MAPAAAAAPNGAQLAQGPQMGPRGTQFEERGDEQSDELGQAIQEVIAAAQSVGFKLPPDGVSQEQLPEVYTQLLAAAAQSEMGQSPDGMQVIDELAQRLGVPSPFGGQDEAMPPEDTGGGEPMMPQGGMPPMRR
jgi:hypothetical protein